MIKTSMFLGGLVLAAALTAEVTHDPREVRLADIRQLTFDGENAEAYWSPDGKHLSFQHTGSGYACDRIYTMPIDGSAPPTLVSTGTGRTTCAYYSYPVGDKIYYASTHAKGGPECPAVPDRSKGYVWPIYSSYEIYLANADGTNPVALTDNDAYDAEATVCPLDGSVIFTSTRNGDLDLYRMDADGSNVAQLTDLPGYDGGAFFSPDCTQIVWRASRPQGAELDEYRALLAEGLVRPSRLEIFVANADGTNVRQITDFGAGTFAPFFHPNGKRILFSSNTPNPRGREFDIWAVDADGSNLERITFTPEFDGFPMFSPDGKWLAFSSNRNNRTEGDTNVFVARWVEDATPVAEARLVTGADRVAADARWLADDARGGRGLGSDGLAAARDYLAEQFLAIGLEPAVDGGYLAPFEAPYAVEVGEATRLEIDGEGVAGEAFQPAGFSARGDASGEVVFAGWGIVDEEAGRDDYAGIDATGKVVLVRRFSPEDGVFANNDGLQRRLGDLRYKAFQAREKGAVALLVADLPEPVEGKELPAEAPFPRLKVDTEGDAGIPVVVISRELGERLSGGGANASMDVDLVERRAAAANVVGVVRAGAETKHAGIVVIGAHYDHLGMGGRGSLGPDVEAIHNGADDNASGTAALLEAARTLVARRAELTRDVWIVAFSAEESGLLGSARFVKNPPGGFDPAEVVAMVNMDMVGRMRQNTVSVLGSDSAPEWKELVQGLCGKRRIVCSLGGDGYGPSDHSSFYSAGAPVVHLFTGIHDDYHKPSDDSHLLNVAGIAKVAGLAADIATAVVARPERLTYQQAPAPPPSGDVRAFGASLGTIPDYAEDGKPGVLLSGARVGSPAEAAGVRRGDRIVRLGGSEIRDIHDFVFVLRKAKPGDKTILVVEREGKRVELPVTYGESRGMR
jgi:Tol biopolymer transport system component